APAATSSFAADPIGRCGRRSFAVGTCQPYRSQRDSRADCMTNCRTVRHGRQPDRAGPPSHSNLETAKEPVRDATAAPCAGSFASAAGVTAMADVPQNTYANWGFNWRAFIGRASGWVGDMLFAHGDSHIGMTVDVPGDDLPSIVRQILGYSV